MTSWALEPLVFRRRVRPDRVLIIGGGLAGLFTALRLAPLPVTVLTPRPLGEGASSAWAQGGIAAAIGEGDTPEAHASDTIAAGAGLVEPAMAGLLAREAGARIEDLLRYGVPFDRDLEGKLNLSREAAHGARRIVRVNGDRAGRAVMAALISAVAATPSILVLESVAAVELALADGKVIGAHAGRAGRLDRAAFLPARAVVLATGGLGQLYQVTTNPCEAAGSGLAMAARAGAIVADAEFVQFHPTAFDVGRDPAPLASEALRGEGATLINAAGERFMPAVHPLAELAPRDIVARAVHREIASGRGAFLDCRVLNVERDFPTAAAICREAGIDAARQPIPVAPAAHYHMGGVLADANGRTTLDGLWACGEVACTGVHGANRLASNSLLEAVVFGARVAEDIAGAAPHWYAMGATKAAPDRLHFLPANANADERVRQALRQTMTAAAGVERTDAGLRAALVLLSSLAAEAHAPEVSGMVTAALLLVTAACTRRESRGAHCRLDYPQTVEPALHSYQGLRQAEAIASEALGREYGGLDEGIRHPSCVAV